MNEEEVEARSEDGAKMGQYGTREYKKGRFHVCETISFVERERNGQDTQIIKKMLGAISIQGQQIALLVKAIKSSGLSKMMEDEFSELENKLKSISLSFESYR